MLDANRRGSEKNRFEHELGFMDKVTLRIFSPSYLGNAKHGGQYSLLACRASPPAAALTPREELRLAEVAPTGDAAPAPPCFAMVVWRLRFAATGASTI